MKEVVASGRTVEDAKRDALKELGVSSEKQVEIEIIDEGSKGVFGWGTKFARVKVKLIKEVKKTSDNNSKNEQNRSYHSNENENGHKSSEIKTSYNRDYDFLSPKGAPPLPIAKEQEFRDYKKESRDYKDKRETREPKVQRESRYQREPRESRESREPRKTRDYKPAQRENKPRYEAKEVKEIKEPKVNPEYVEPKEIEPKAPVVQIAEPDPDMPFAPSVVIQSVMDKMGLKTKVDKNRIDGNDVYSIQGEDLGVLIGKHGQTLEALQFVVNLIVLRNTGSKKKITLDVEGYRSRREKSLRELAKRLADKVKRDKRKVVLEPMLPSERRIIHLTLQRNPHVYTYSQGEEPMRKVIISPKR